MENDFKRWQFIQKLLRSRVDEMAEGIMVAENRKEAAALAVIALALRD